MIEVTLKKPNGEAASTFEIASHARELPLSNYISFIAEADKLRLPGTNQAIVMAKAVSEYSGVNLEEILDSSMGKRWDDEDSAIEGIRTLYGYCVSRVNNFNGKVFKKSFMFRHKDQEFEIPGITPMALSGYILPDVSVNESVEAFETVRLFELEIKNSAIVRELAAAFDMATGSEKTDYYKRLTDMVPTLKSTKIENIDTDKIVSEKGDPNGNLPYTRYMKMLAIIARAPGERLPTDDTKKKEFIEERCKFFEGISTETALNADFFLHSTLRSLDRTLPVIGSLIVPAFALGVEMTSTNGRHIKEPLSTRKVYSKGLVGEA